MGELRKVLSAEGMWSKVYQLFNQVKEPNKANKNRNITLSDCLMSAAAMFSFKYPSMLQFDRDSHTNESIKHNLNTLFHVARAPSDTYMRERLDDVEPSELRKPFKALFSELQRGKALEAYQYFNGYYLLSVDGTGHFSSKEIHCNNCCEKKHRNGTKTYQHQMLSGAIVHPALKIPIPLCPEPITKQDGATKNDCERNAAKRFYSDFRREHPHLKTIAIEDALSANAPHINMLKNHNIKFIISVKPDGNKSLFDFVDSMNCETYEHIDKNETVHRYRFVNQVPLNDSNPDCMVNFLEYWEVKKNGKQQHFTWCTDFIINKYNCHQLMKGGRARWKIENETFNTLKNQGYAFEHNFGHGNNNLCTILSFLMMLAFLIDQIQCLCCPLFKQALESMQAKIVLWRRMRSLLDEFLIKKWKDIYLHLSGHNKARELELDTT